MKQTKNSFKKKFNVILLGSLTLLTVLGTIIVLTIFSIKNNVENTQRVSETSTNIALCQSAVRGFLLNAWSDTLFVRTGSNQEFEKFQTEATALEVNLDYLRDNSSGEDLETVENTAKTFNELQQNFKRIAELIKERGFKNLGLEGKLRDAIHRLENSASITDKTPVLVLRKHEKDFFLRRDMKYFDNFEKDAPKLAAFLNTLPESADKVNLLDAYQTYLSTFKNVVDLETEIGLTRSSGIRNNINVSIGTSIDNLNKLNNRFDKRTKQLITTIIVFISLIFNVIIGVVFVGLNKLIKPVFEPMQDIQAKASEISGGNLSVQFDDHKNNEILKDLIEGFEKIIAKFKNTMWQVEQISTRQMLQELPIHSEKDEVGITVNKIISQIKTIDEEEKKRTWHNEGLAKFATILRLNNMEETEMYDTIVSQLVTYLEANQGILFIIEGENTKEPYLSMKGCYAYNRKKYLDVKIDFGEGLAGTCWAEGKTIFMTKVPQEYVRITSGLGDATPSSIVIVPIMFNDKVQGIIELASFEILEEFKIKFTEAIAESIGSAVHNIKTNTKTLALLQRSQEMTEELRSQEEEMRQSMEELQATQEEMKRMSTSVQNELEALKLENERLKTQETTQLLVNMSSVPTNGNGHAKH